jgi:5-methylcytosine-specific restriction enzyme A
VPAMPRSLPEWIGVTDDTPVPPRVRLRVFERYGRRCDPLHGCGRHLRPGDAWTCDHINAVINGGPNRETNLHPLCEWCEPPKTEAGVHEKSRVYRKRLRHAGIKLKAKGGRCPAHLRADGRTSWTEGGSADRRCSNAPRRNGGPGPHSVALPDLIA